MHDCMSSGTAHTFGLDTCEQWIPRLNDTMLVSQAVGPEFVKNCRATRLEKVAFVATRYEDVDDAHPPSGGATDLSNDNCQVRYCM